MNKPHELKQQVKINRLQWIDIFKGGGNASRYHWAYGSLWVFNS